MKHISKLKIRNIALYNALKIVTKDALQVLSQAIENGAKITTFLESKWQPSEQENLFLRVNYNKPEYWILVHNSKTEIEALPSYNKAKTLIEADEIWFRHMNKLNGSCMGSSRLELDQILKSIFYSSLGETHQLKPSEKHINKQIDNLENYFSTSDINHSRTTPIYGITLSKNFSINENTSFEILPDDAVCTLLQKGIIPDTSLGRPSDNIFNPPRVAIVSKFKLPKIIRDDEDNSPTDLQPVTDLYNRLNEEEAKALDLLSIIVDTQVLPTGTVTEALGTIGSMSGGYQYTINPLPLHAWAITSKALKKDEEDKFCKLLIVLNESKKKKSRHYLIIAVRRYSLALSRPLLDDKLIDLMICAEALLLRVEQNELTYKLAYRVALFIGGNPSQQKDIFKFIGEAYSMRSKVVHGTKSYTQDQKDIEALSSIITKLSELLRQALLKMLTLALNPQAPEVLIDWKDFMFKEKTVRVISKITKPKH